MKISNFNMNSGRMIREDGSVVNIADILTSDANAVSDIKERISSYQIHSGRFIREDGSIVNLADLIADGQIGGGGGTGTAVITQVDHGTSDTTFELPPNQYHTWGEVASLTLTLGAGTDGQANGYWFSFDSGDTATTLSLPETVQTDIVVEPNMHYECSIVGNYMTFEEWEVSA